MMRDMIKFNRPGRNKTLGSRCLGVGERVETERNAA